MKRWIDLGSDVSWDDYGGKWAKKGPDGLWYVVRFENMHEACGERDCETTGTPEYLAESLIVDLKAIGEDGWAESLRCCGMRFEGDLIVDESGTVIVDRLEYHDRYEAVLVEACVSYGHYAPVGSHSGKSYPERVRAAARRDCEALMRDVKATAPGKRHSRLFDHDRPQGGRCLQAAARLNPVPRFDGRCGVCNSNSHATVDCPPKGPAS